MISTDQLDTLLNSGGNVVGRDGTKIGKIGQIFLDDQTGEPEWVTARTGMFGGGESFVPLADATTTGDDVQVPYNKDTVKNAPHSDDENGFLSQDQEAALYSHYGLDYSEQSSDSGLPDGTDYDTQAGAAANLGYDPDGRDQSGDVGQDTSGPNTDDAMTRSEERLHVGTEKVQAGKARLRKYITSEQVTRTVPVSHEEVRVEREPITDANRGNAMSGGELTTEEHEVTLTADRVVVDKDVVPVERVRLGTETVTEQQNVTEEVRKEQIETEGDDIAGGLPTTGDRR